MRILTPTCMSQLTKLKEYLSETGEEMTSVRSLSCKCSVLYLLVCRYHADAALTFTSVSVCSVTQQLFFCLS
jgi:hypothetical protein